MLSSQIGDIWINFAAWGPLSLTCLLAAADTWKLTLVVVVARLQFLFHSSQSLLLHNLVVRDLLQNCFLIQVLLQIVIIVVNFIYTTIRLS